MFTCPYVASKKVWCLNLNKMYSKKNWFASFFFPSVNFSLFIFSNCTQLAYLQNKQQFNIIYFLWSITMQSASVVCVRVCASVMLNFVWSATHIPWLHRAKTCLRGNISHLPADNRRCAVAWSLLSRFVLPLLRIFLRWIFTSQTTVAWSHLSLLTW